MRIKNHQLTPNSSTSPPVPSRCGTNQAFLGVHFTTNLGQELHVWRFGGKFFGETHLQRLNHFVVLFFRSWVFRGTNVSCKSPNGNIWYPIQSRRLVGWVLAVERICLLTRSRVLVLIISKYVLKIILALLVQLLPLQLANNVGDVHWLHKCVCVFEYLEKAKKLPCKLCIILLGS